jgi:hypothetical protein
MKLKEYKCKVKCPVLLTVKDVLVQADSLEEAKETLRLEKGYTSWSILNVEEMKLEQ